MGAFALAWYWSMGGCLYRDAYMGYDMHSLRLVDSLIRNGDVGYLREV